MKSFWRALGINKPRGPSIRAMAATVGLPSTYDYIYFAASNFVHFNPQALLRMGWGPQKGPLRFAAEHMAPYYAGLARFYGAVLFIGFHAAFAPQFFDTDLTPDVNRLLAALGEDARWPEIITFEEMNVTRPPFSVMRVLAKAAYDSQHPLESRGILREVRGLASRNPTST